MPCITFPINPSNVPLLEIGISTPQSLAPVGTIPTINWIKAIADTGCTSTSIFSGAATKAGLQIVSKGMVNSTTHSVPVNIYYGDLILRYSYGSKPFEFRFFDRSFLELVRPDPNFEALLGMDILSIGSYHINGLTKQATFCW